jgi:hypothetical protein
VRERSQSKRRGDKAEEEYTPMPRPAPTAASVDLAGCEHCRAYAHALAAERARSAALQAELERRDRAASGQAATVVSVNQRPEPAAARDDSAPVTQPHDPERP